MDNECSEEYFGPKRDSLYIVILLTVIYIIIFFTGSIGNISTCIVIAKNKTMHTATNYYLFSLAMSDQLLLIFGLPHEVYTFWYRHPYTLGSAVCFLRGLFAEISANATVLIITAFTVERYLAICHPFLSHTLSNLSRAIKLIIIIWLLSIGLAVPQALFLKVYLLNGTCPQCIILDTRAEPFLEASTFLLFLIPMAIITVLYILIGIRLKSPNGIKKINTHTTLQRKSSWKVVKMLVAVVVGFFVCWAPFHIQRLVSIYQAAPSNSKPSEFANEDTKMYLKIYEVITYISGILYYLSATVNPVLYNIMSVKFRDAFKETFSCFWFKENRLKSQRSLSGVSKFNTKFLDSVDYGSQDHSTQSFVCSMHKNSVESTNSYLLRKMHPERHRRDTECNCTQ